MASGAQDFDTQGPQRQDGQDSHDVEEGERQYTLSISDEDRRKSFEIEDRRWARDKQIRDWLKLGLMVAINLAWMLAVYFLEPGLR